MGFLNAQPKTWPTNRLEHYRKRKPSVCPVPIRAGQYLLDALFKAGPIASNGMDRVSLTWAEVLAFSHCTESLREPWERQALFDMSRAYLDGLTEGEDPFGEPPYEKR